jgi:hypothetical protein
MTKLLAAAMAATVAIASAAHAEDTFTPYVVYENGGWLLPGYGLIETEARQECLADTAGTDIGGDHAYTLCIPTHIAATHHLMDIPAQAAKEWHSGGGPAPILTGHFGPRDIPWLLSHGAFVGGTAAGAH